MTMDYGGNRTPQTLDLLDHGEIMAIGEAIPATYLSVQSGQDPG